MHKINGCIPCLCIEKLKLGEKGVDPKVNWNIGWWVNKNSHLFFMRVFAF